MNSGPSPATRLTLQAAWLATTVMAAMVVVYAVLAAAPSNEHVMPGFFTWVGDALLLDLGESSRVRIGESVARLAAQALLVSIVLVGLAWLISLGLGAALAWLWLGRRSMAAAATRPAVYLLSAAPAFLLAHWMIVLINSNTYAAINDGMARPDWFPIPAEPGALRMSLAAVALAIGSGMLMETARGLRDEVARVSSAEFILFARANGQPMFRHFAQNLVGPLGALALNRLTALFGSAIVIEVVFNLGGLGRLTWDAALARDSRLLLGAALAWAILYATARWCQEATRVFSDPRRGEHT